MYISIHHSYTYMYIPSVLTAPTKQVFTSAGTTKPGNK